MTDLAAIIRPATLADAAGIARVHVNTWQTAYKGIIAGETLAGLSIEQRQQNWARRLEAPPTQTFLLVAERDNQVIGFSAGGPERTGDPLFTGEIYALYLLKEYQQQGIGRMLVEASVISLVASGMQAMLIWVLRDNPSRKFYEAMGGKYVREQAIEISGQSLAEVAYGWDDLSRLVKKNA